MPTVRKQWLFSVTCSTLQEFMEKLVKNKYIKHFTIDCHDCNRGYDNNGREYQSMVVNNCEAIYDWRGDKIMTLK
jgi:hypothetical protein